MISIYKEKAFDKIYYPLIIRILNKRDIQGMHLNIKVIYNKRTANIIFKGEKLNAFPLNTGKKTRMLILISFTQLSFGSPSGVIRQEKEIKGIQVRKEEKLLDCR